MAIKYYANPEKKMVVAVLKGTEMDCINKIEKIMGSVDWVQRNIQEAIRIRCWQLNLTKARLS